jgi:hypothetical protein
MHFLPVSFVNFAEASALLEEDNDECACKKKS